MNFAAFFSVINTQYTIGENSIAKYIEALVIVIGVIVLFKIIQRILISRLRRISKKTHTDIDDLIVHVVESFKAPFYYVLALYLALGYLTFPQVVDNAASIIFILFLSYYGIQAVQIIIEYIIFKAIQKKDNDRVPVRMIQTTVRIVVWSLGILFILSNFGIEVTSLIAGLGIGGVAVALALQNILGDLFSSFAIYFDKPFEIGDFIVVGEHMGIVERVGIKTTRIRALQGEEIVIPNKELTSTRIQNFKKMRERRVVFLFGIVYGTPNEKIRKIPDIVKKAVEKENHARFERSHFKDFGDSCLHFESVYYILSGNYNEYMDIQERINLSVKEAFEIERIDMAFPTRTIYIEK